MPMEHLCNDGRWLPEARCKDCEVAPVPRHTRWVDETCNDDPNTWTGKDWDCLRGCCREAAAVKAHRLIRELTDARDGARREVERLREALEDVVLACETGSTNPQGLVLSVGAIASGALKGAS